MAKRFIEDCSEGLQAFSPEELDALQYFLVSTLVRNTELEIDEIYSYVYGEGKRIFWN